MPKPHVQDLFFGSELLRWPISFVSELAQRFVLPRLGSGKGLVKKIE